MQIKVRTGHEFQADDQLLELRLPGIHASNEIMGLLFRGPEARELIGRAGELIQGFIKDTRIQFAKLGDDRYRAVALEAAMTWLQVNLPEVLGVLPDTLLPLIGDRAVLIAIPAIDIEENREALAADQGWVTRWGDPLAVVEMPGQDHIPPTLRGIYSPALRRWALARVGGDHAARIAFHALVMLFSGGLGKQFGARSGSDAPEVLGQEPQPPVTTVERPTHPEDSATSPQP